MCKTKTSKTHNFHDVTELAEHVAWTDDQLMEMLLIANADKHQLGEAQEELRNNLLKSVASYTSACNEALALLLNHKNLRNQPSTKQKCLLVPMLFL